MNNAPEPHYKVVWPRSPLGVQHRRLAPRLTDLRGTRIAFVWDYMFRGDEMFAVLQRELRERFGAELLPAEHFGNTHGPDEVAVIANLPNALREWRVDAAISGVGC